MDPLVSAQSLHVVPADDAAHRVPDHMDPFVPGLAAHLFDQVGESLSHGPDVLGQGRVVQGDDATEATAGPIEILDTANVATSFPGFTGLARSAGIAIEECA